MIAAAMSVRTWWLLLGLLTVLSMARVAATHQVFSQGYDEPWHVAAGYDLVKHGSFVTDLHHPPLARFFFGVPLLRFPDPGVHDVHARGNALLFHDGRYPENLALARVGNLVFLALGIVGVALWGRHLFNPVVGLLAALLYASLPPILAFAGFATTDLAIATTMTLALYALTVLVEDPSWKKTTVLSVAVAAGMLSKFSFLIYFPPAAVLVLIARKRFPVRQLIVAAALAFFAVWAVYGFSVGTLRETDPAAGVIAQDVFGSTSITTIPLPVPAYVEGLLGVRRHDLKGHPAFLLGEVRAHGWWYYFPVALFFKTPIPFLVLSLIGCVLAARKHSELPWIAAAVLGIAMTSSINIGVRHVLPIYAPLAVCGAVAIVEWQRLRAAAVALVLWLVIGVGLAHPDYLPWFNGSARHPETILSDSNLDWGQDVLRLAAVTQELRIPHLMVGILSTADPDGVGMPPRSPLQTGQPVDRWLALSEMYIIHARNRSAQDRAWIDRLIGGKPYRRVGKSIRLYDLTVPGPSPAPAPGSPLRD